jgi:26S proteasome regulatory subunit T1
MPKEE